MAGTHIWIFMLEEFFMLEEVFILNGWGRPYWIDSAGRGTITSVTA